jgi:transcriptional regulator with XRE-family HTH domain
MEHHIKCRVTTKERVILRENLRAERKLKDLTQEQAADQIGTTARQYSRLETGTSDGSIKVWKRLRDLLGKPIDYLLEQVADHKGEPETNQDTRPRV